MANELHQNHRMTRKVAAATLIGSTVEWYDFFIYGTASALVLSELFFPSFSSTAGTLLGFATFAVGWVARPLGGIVAGHFGDRVGRRSMLIITVTLMGLCTMLIGLLPTYAVMGVWAPTLLVILRLIQGLAVGGEYAGSLTMAVEHAPDGRRGLHASWPQLGITAGLVLGTGVFYLFKEASGDQFLAWGWRIPFLLSFILVITGLVIRLKIAESPAFKETKRQRDVARLPIAQVLRHHPSRVLIVLVSMFGPNVYFYVFGTYVLSYATTWVDISAGTILTAVAIAALVESITMPTWASLSDRIGRRPVIIGGLVFLCVTAAPFFWAIGQESATLIFIALTICMGIGHSAAYGTMASFFSELFPTPMRYSGVSLGYQLAGTVFGAPLPIIATLLVGANGGGPWYLVGYMAVAALVSAGTVWLAPETSRLTFKEDLGPAPQKAEPDLQAS